MNAYAIRWFKTPAGAQRFAARTPGADAQDAELHRPGYLIPVWHPNPRLPPEMRADIIARGNPTSRTTGV